MSSIAIDHKPVPPLEEPSLPASDQFRMLVTRYQHVLDRFCHDNKPFWYRSMTVLERGVATRHLEEDPSHYGSPLVRRPPENMFDRLQWSVPGDAAASTSIAESRNEIRRIAGAAPLAQLTFDTLKGVLVELVEQDRDVAIEWSLVKVEVGIPRRLEHQAVSVYERGEPWSEGFVFDPWVEQAPRVYRFDDWKYLLHRLGVRGTPRVDSASAVTVDALTT